ncbi:uncharacterized protein LOC129905618 [Episyrphus balteatus]|uniref:uncharacterized protein LOC129905618 n=1 Tax=Episyrphus balteatus TaxID=286459 RepID=UPI0024869A47|nr:uncharacterized protein LOC129905618 [Episyrphus balteatus]
MKHYVIWLILLHLCCCEDLDYIDYYPQTIPLQAENPSPQYKAVMTNLYNNWHSPISYLKKRGYMPNNIQYEPKENLKKKIYPHKNLEKGENYFFFPDNKEPRTRNTIMLLENNSSPDTPNTEVTEAPSPPVVEESKNKNDTTGIINKVKDKFLSIFSHKDKSKTGQVEENFDLEDPEFLENYNDEYEFSDRRIFARSIPEKPLKPLNSSNENILSNLTDNEIHFIKSFINWFKENKNNFKFLSLSNVTTSGKSPDTKDNDKKEDTKPNVQTSTESGFDKKVTSTSKPVNITTECTVVGSEPSITVKTIQGQSNGSVSKNISSKTSDAKDTFTVDLDINQKNGTGEVTMGGDKTTQCAPLRLNDMSFDLEWNKINTAPQNGRAKMNILDLPYGNQEPQGQSLAAKFLQDVNSYPDKSYEYLKTPYADNFLDSQQSLPSDLDLPLKSSTKREVALPSFGKKGKIYSFPDTEDDDESFLANGGGASPKRRIKSRVKGKGRNKKKPKHKNSDSGRDFQPSETFEDDTKEGTDFNSFDELKDIQFRVNNDDEEAISSFISSLNAPPEVFSFDVDKYLKTAKENMEPKAPEFEYKSPEARTYYEFLESPSVENERLPLIETAPEDIQVEPGVEKRSRNSPMKRDLLRQYIKGVSSALNHNFDDIYCENCNKNSEVKPQRSSNSDTDLQIRTDNLIDRFSTNLDAMDSIKSNENYDDSINNYFLLNDGSDQAIDQPKQNQEIVPNDYSPQSLEIDLDLDKKFRDLNIGRYTNDLSRRLVSVDSKNTDEVPNEGKEIEVSNLDNDPY